MRRSIFSAVLTLTVCIASAAHSAETIYGAMAKAYENNPSLNAARAGLRAVDENVPLAKSGHRPRVQATSSLLYNFSEGARGYSTASFGVEINQSIFDGFETRNKIKGAEAGVRAERANLLNTEQNTLFDASQAYMDVLQNRQIASLRAQNIDSLNEQLRSERSRFEVGEGTRTDVAQAQASLAAARAQLIAAQAQVKSSEAIYMQIVGTEPGALKTPAPLSKLLPRSLAQAEQIAFSSHPAIEVRNALVDSGLFSVKAAEGAFLPQVGVSASVSRNLSSSSNSGRVPSALDSSSESTTGRVGLSVTVPIYQGGQASATVRKSKEELGQARLEVDVARNQVRAAVVSAYTQLEASRASVSANQEGVSAARLALNGVVEERSVGQRTTLDVLNARTVVLNAQIALVQAQRNQVVSSYALASAIGRLNAKRLGLSVAVKDPEEHYNAVKDKWFGLRTPDGR
ncbi:TolC family outer membrane protein [Ahrensia kielensis]|uniref:TolC family outer membrane protein n=1 Tax=Ahrensia kielensis TaxID=76980 RepID=A0ABU9T5I0_9HYPH